MHKAVPRAYLAYRQGLSLPADGQGFAGEHQRGRASAGRLLCPTGGMAPTRGRWVTPRMRTVTPGTFGGLPSSELTSCQQRREGHPLGVRSEGMQGYRQGVLRPRGSEAEAFQRIIGCQATG